MSTDTLAPTRVTAGQARALLPGLGELLHACVRDGASVSFVLPFGPEAARAFWLDKVLPPSKAAGWYCSWPCGRGVWPARCNWTAIRRPISRTAPRSASCWCTPIFVAAALPAN